jgi:hypothetical protein
MNVSSMSEPGVILSRVDGEGSFPAAQEKILRFAQDDTSHQQEAQIGKF